jgi:hypothetical protein
MADDNNTTPETGDETEDKPPTPRSDDHDVEKLKAALRKANKEAEQFRLKLKEFEDRDKTESEKLADTNRSLEERARKAEIDLCRYRVAMRKGLTETQARRLVGESEEDFESDADELVAAFKSSSEPEATPPATGGRPKEKLRPGAVSDAEPDPDPAEVVAAIPRF